MENIFFPLSRWSNSNDVSWAKSSLLNGSSDNLSNSLNVVYSGNWKTKWKVWETLWWLDEVVKSIKKGESSDGYLWLKVCGPSLVPSCLIGLLYKVVSVESRVWNEWNLLWLESNHLKHLGELIVDLGETSLVPSTGVNLVDSNNDLLYSKKVKKTSVLRSLSLLNSIFGSALAIAASKPPFSAGTRRRPTSGSGSGDHVLNVILVSWSIYNSVVVLVSEELLGVTLNGNSTLTLLLTGIKVVSETEGRLSLLLSHSLKLSHLTLGNSSALEDKVTTGGGLSSIYVPAHNNRKMFFSRVSHFEYYI